MKFVNIFTILCALSLASDALAGKSSKPKKDKKKKDVEESGFVATEETCGDIAEDMVDALMEMIEDFSKEELQEYICNSMERKTVLLPFMEDPEGSIEEEYGNYAPCMGYIFEDFLEELKDPDERNKDFQLALDPEACKREVEDEVEIFHEARRELMRMRNLRGGDRKLLFGWLKRLFRKARTIISVISRGRRWLCRLRRIRWICW